MINFLRHIFNKKISLKKCIICVLICIIFFEGVYKSHCYFTEQEKNNQTITQINKNDIGKTRDFFQELSLSHMSTCELTELALEVLNDFKVLRNSLQKIHDVKKKEIDIAVENAVNITKMPVTNLEAIKNLQMQINSLKSLTKRQMEFLNSCESNFFLDKNFTKSKISFFINNVQDAISNNVDTLNEMCRRYQKNEEMISFSGINKNDNFRIADIISRSSIPLSFLDFDAISLLSISDFLGKGCMAAIFGLKNEISFDKKEIYVIKFQLKHNYDVKKINPNGFQIFTDENFDSNALRKTVKPIVFLDLENYLGQRFNAVIFKKKDCNLYNFLKETEFISSDNLVNIIGSLLNSLSNIHEYGLCHFDIHKLNVLVKKKLNGKYKVLLSDFDYLNSVGKYLQEEINSISIGKDSKFVNPQVCEVFVIAVLMFEILSKSTVYDAYRDIAPFGLSQYDKYFDNKVKMLENFENKIDNFNFVFKNPFIDKTIDLIKKMANIDNNLSVYECKDEFLRIVRETGLEKELDEKLLQDLKHHSKTESEFGKTFRDILDNNAKVTDPSQIVDTKTFLKHS